jgi:uncharacterized repeat protein (TIGR01451 family)
MTGRQRGVLGGLAVSIGGLSLAVAVLAAPPDGQNKLEMLDDQVAVAVPEGWSVAPRFATNSIDLVALPPERLDEFQVPQGDALGVIQTWTPRVTVSKEVKLDHSLALARLQEIASEVGTAPTFATIGGWPALERIHLGYLARRGRTLPNQADAGKALLTTTAIAVDNVVVRYEGVFPPATEPALLEQATALGRATKLAIPGDPARALRELEELRAAPRRDFTLFKATPAPSGGAAVGSVVHSLAAGAALRVMGGTGEIEITASGNGQDVVVARQNSTRTSNDGGQTFPFSSGMPFGNYGDPSLAVGQSGTFYYAGISSNTPCGGNPLFGCSTGVARSTNRGQTFPVFTHAVTCPQPPNPAACFPDQEHIAADRWNAAVGGDQVYSVWRNFTAGELPTIVCSQDGGLNWTAPLTVDNPGYVPRVTVGQDGFVYVVYGQGSNLRVNKYSSCSAGLTQQAGFPLTITAYTGVACPVPGLDRCNDGNVLASHMLAVDESTPLRVFFVYAAGNGSGESIFLRRSTDGGATWGAAITVNGGAAAARRYMPWVSVRGGVVHVTWYDQRAAIGGATNDLTDFYRNSVNGSTLAVGTEVALQINQDPLCNSGWPCGTRSTNDSESCTTQPQLAGFCKDGSGNVDPGVTRCDFSSGPACPVGYTCQTDGGCPKYGDYNGNAIEGGWAFSGWTSAVAPPGLAENGGLEIYFEAYQTGPNPDITINKVDTADPVNPGNALGYVVTVTNNGTTLATGISVTDTLTNPFQAISATGWSCVTPGVGNTGLLTCSLASLAGGASAQFVVSVTVPNIIGTLTNSAAVTGANDANPGNNSSPVVSTQVLSPADVKGTKTYSSTWGNNLYPGAPLTYTVVLTNSSPFDQFDNPGNEFTDVIPAQLTITGVSATSGIIAFVGNTVSWNGVVPGSSSVTLQINCQINVGTAGATVSNQGTVLCDANGDGVNESNRLTDDPGVGGANDPTVFQVKVPVPTLGTVGLAALLLLVAAAGVWLLRRYAAA